MYVCEHNTPPSLVTKTKINNNNTQESINIM